MCAGCTWVSLSAMGCGGFVDTAGDIRRALLGPGQVMGDFETGSAEGWSGTGGAEVVVVSEHAAKGAKAIRADLPVAPYPGIGLESGTKMDWSRCHALRFSVFNSSRQQVNLSIRVDDSGSKSAADRFTTDAPYKLSPGDNQVELPIAALRQGSFLSRGLDVSSIKLVRMFAMGLKEPVNLYFDNIRVDCQKAPEGDTLVVASFPGAAKWEARDKAAVAIADWPPTGGAPRGSAAGAKALKVDIGPEGKYPGVTFRDVQPDWLTCDLLSVSIFCPEDAKAPARLNLKITDATNRSATIICRLAKGANLLRIPLDMVSGIQLGRVREVSIFAGEPAAPQTFYLGGIELKRLRVKDSVACHDASAQKPSLIFDMAGLRVPRNTCFLVYAVVPLPKGECRIVRCSSSGRDLTRYALPHEALKDYTGDPIACWLYVSDHGSWHFWPQDVVLKEVPKDQPTVVRFKVE